MKKLYVSQDTYQDNDMGNTMVKHLIQVYGAEKAESVMSSYSRFDDDATKFVYNLEGKPGMVVSDITSIESNGQSDLSLKITVFKEGDGGRETHFEELPGCETISDAAVKAREIIKNYTSEHETPVVSNMGSTICINTGLDQIELHQVGYDKYHMVFIDNEYGTPGFSTDINMPHTQGAKEKATELMVDLAELGDMKEQIFEKYATIYRGGINYEDLKADIDDIKDISKCVDNLNIDDHDHDNSLSEEVEL